MSLSAEEALENLAPGVTLASVLETKDPKGWGRVKVSFTLKGQRIDSDWVQVVSFFAGPGRGAFFLPQVNDSALVAFADGDPSKPFVLGFLWNGVQTPPLPQAQQQDVRVIKTMKGKSLTFDDSAQGKIVITDEKNNRIEIDSANNSISLTSQGDITISATGSITLKAQKIVQQSNAINTEVTSAGIKLNGGSSIALKAAMIDIN